MWPSVCIYASPVRLDESRRLPYMLIGQWVDKDSTISLGNEPPLRRSTVSQDRESGRGQWEILWDVLGRFARSVLLPRSTEHRLGIWMWTYTHILLFCKHSPVSGVGSCKMSWFSLFFLFFFKKEYIKSSCLSVWWNCTFDITPRTSP